MAIDLPDRGSVWYGKKKKYLDSSGGPRHVTSVYDSSGAGSRNTGPFRKYEGSCKNRDSADL